MISAPLGKKATCADEVVPNLLRHLFGQAVLAGRSELETTAADAFKRLDLSRLAEAYLEIGAYDAAATVSEALVSTHRDASGFWGPSVSAHTVLGVIALTRGDIDGVKTHLNAWLDAPGPPWPFRDPDLRLPAEVSLAGHEELAFVYLKAKSTRIRRGERRFPVWVRHVERLKASKGRRNA
jgi:hypothetical protein